VVPGDGIGADLLEGVAEVRLAVGVIDGGREVEARHERSAVGVLVDRGRRRAVRRAAADGPLFRVAAGAAAASAAAAPAAVGASSRVGLCGFAVAIGRLSASVGGRLVG